MSDIECKNCDTEMEEVDRTGSERKDVILFMCPECQAEAVVSIEYNF